jgi:recombination protein RecR
MDPIQKLSLLFAEFPGIGSRQSRRFVYFLLKKNKGYIRELTELINALGDIVLECTRCHRYFMKKYDAAPSRCGVCTDAARDKNILMVVEKDADLEAIERSGLYQGTYFILGGILPILEKNPGAKIRINELVKLLEKESMDIKEIILACAVTPESEHTAEYVRGEIAPIAEAHLVTITTLGRGLSTGTELEYSDAETLRYALEGRK